MGALAVYVGSSTLTSTIPGLSAAGGTPENAPYTPTPDLKHPATNLLGVGWDEMKRAVYDEYARLVGLAKG